MSTSTLWKVYILLRDGYAQVAVAKALKVTRQTVSYHTKRLVKGGYLRPVRGTNPTLYRATSKAVPEGVIGDTLSVRSHHTSRLFKVVHPPKRPFPWLWDKSWTPSTVTFHHAKNLHLSTKGGTVLVKALRYIDGKSLTIWLDEDHLVTPEQAQDHDERATQEAVLVAREVQRLTGMVLGLPEVPQASHYAMDAPPDVWLDRSLGSPELETSNVSKATLWLTLPEVIQSLQEDLDALKANQVELVTTLQSITEALGPLMAAREAVQDHDGYEVAYR